MEARDDPPAASDLRVRRTASAPGARLRSRGRRPPYLHRGATFVERPSGALHCICNAQPEEEGDVDPEPPHDAMDRAAGEVSALEVTRSPVPLPIRGESGS